MIRLILLSALLLLSACALSPQQVELTPQVSAPAASNLGHNLAIIVVGDDARSTRVIGSRGGVYANKSEITTSNNVAAALAKQVRGHLQSIGFNTLNPEKDAPQLTVSLQSLQYTPAQGYIVNRVEVSATVSAIFEDGDGSFTRTYNSQIEFKQPLTPSEDKNQAMLDKVLTRCLDKLVNDKQLLDRLNVKSTPAVVTEIGSIEQPGKAASWVF